MCPVGTQPSIVESRKHHGCPEKKTTKHGNHPELRTRSPSSPATDPTTNLHAPAYATTTYYSNTHVQHHMRWYTPNRSLCRAGVSIVSSFSTIPGSERSVPGRVPLHAPRSLSRARLQIFRREHRGLTCGAGVARSWCQGRSNVARHSQLCIAYVITYTFQDAFCHYRYHYLGALL